MLNKKKLKDGLSYNSMMYLELIQCIDNCTISELAQQLNISKSAVTLKINELEKLGYIRKNQCDKDKRIYYLHVTEAVEEMSQSCVYLFNQLENKIIEKFEPEAINHFCDILNMMTEVLEEGKINE